MYLANGILTRAWYDQNENEHLKLVIAIQIYVLTDIIRQLD